MTNLSAAARLAQRSAGVLAGYVAFAWGLAFAAISFYWGVGGTLGLDTIGGSLERLARAHDRTSLIAVWVTGFVKVAVALLALALAGTWAARLPRRPVTVLGWVAATFLTLYGGILVVAEALVAIGAITPAQPVDWKPLLWHLYVWDMSFLVWGILFGVATWHFSRTASDPDELNV
jgi:uncharacterized protein DUF3995